MQSNRRIAGIVLLILLTALVQWPQATAITPQDQTISITDTNDDLFITETGIGIDSALCHILDPTMDIRSFLVFRELEINYWEPLENATLRFRTTANLDFEADSSVTIYGMRYSDLQREGVLNPSWVLSVPLTTAYVNVNTSQFYGQTWHEVNVTTIVEELIRSYDWDGDGHAGVETGDAIGFFILGAEGYDTRWFIDYLYGTPSLASQLVIHWNHEPPPPAEYPSAIFNETYGNFTIWYVPETGYSKDPMEYHFYLGPAEDLKYDDVHSPPASPSTIFNYVDIDYSVKDSTQRKIERTSDGTLYSVFMDKNDYTIKYRKSVNNGASWTSLTVVSDANAYFPCMAVDSQDNLHFAYQDEAGANDQIYYTMYNATSESWDARERISDATSMENYGQWAPVLAVDGNDDVHCVWSGGPTNRHTWYANKTTSWSYPIKLSTVAGMASYDQGFPTIAVDSRNYLHVIWPGRKTGAIDQLWYITRKTSWSVPIIITTEFTGYGQKYGSLAIDSQDNIHVSWMGKSVDYGTEQIWHKSYTTSWSEPVRISTYTGMSGRQQEDPSIAVDSTDSIHVVWEGSPLGWYRDIWYANFTTEWQIEALNQSNYVTTEALHPQLRWSMWSGLQADHFIVVDSNGTVVQDDLDSQDDAEDWIDIYDPDPEDPDPGGQWSEGPGGATGPLSRFRMRLYFLVVGMGCLFGPLMFFAWKRPSGYYILCGFIIMLMGIGLLMGIGDI